MVSLLAVLMQVAPTSPPKTVLADGPTCAQCVVERYRLATVTDDSLPGPVGPFATITVTSTGHILLARLGITTPFLADQRGIVIRQIGREGRGPGEYQQAWYAVESKDGYYVPDIKTARITHLSREFEMRSSFTFPAAQLLTAPVLVDDRLVVNAEIRTRNSVAQPIHVIAPDGRVVRSFGNGASAQGPLHRALAAGAQGTVWVAPRDRYRLEQWDTAGHLRTVVERPVSWFSSSEAAAGNHRIRQIYQDKDGLLWVHIILRSATKATIIEVIDPVRRQVVASGRIEGWGSDPVAGGFYMNRYEESSTGKPRLEVWGFRLRR